MSRFRTLYKADLARCEGSISLWTRRFHFYLRALQCSRSRLAKLWCHLRFRALSRQHRMELSYGAYIGKGLLLTDPWLITVNSNAVIGEDVTCGRNVTIGKQNRGDLEGSPVIGDRVSIGDDAVIVGRITIGDDVRIAPKAYVNRDIPAGAEAFGSPCRIRPQN